MAGFLPVIAAFERSFGVNENVGDILRVARTSQSPLRISSNGL